MTVLIEHIWINHGISGYPIFRRPFKETDKVMNELMVDIVVFVQN